jgi:DNA polymerase I-like protein with 3'-5' exonuclease and polymerase domains
MNTYAIDFETYYDKENSITTLGQWHYLRSPSSDIYLVAIHGPGVEYVGSPKNAPWAKIDGHKWIAHNYSFDGAVIERLREQGCVQAKPVAWDCTANLSVAVGAPRNLAGASRELLSREMNKDPRDKMNSKKWSDVENTEFGKEVLEYASKDAQACYGIYEKFSKDMLPAERDLSRHTIEMGWRGINVDQDAVSNGVKTLQRVTWESENALPWIDETDGVVLSTKAFRRECAKAGIPWPTSLAENSEECALWEAQYGEQVPFVGIMRDWRKANSLLAKLKVMQSRIKPDGTMGYGLKYMGAHTGRWSGDSKFNVQNLPRNEMFGVDLRGCIIPRPGKKFVICDLAQIEPRVLAWLSGNEGLLQAIKNGYGIYEAAAKNMGLWDGEKGTLKKVDAPLYQLIKAMVLGLGYGAGAKKFALIAKMQYGIDMTETKSNMIVNDFRTRNQPIIDLWRKLEGDFQRAKADKQLEVGLPSGRVLTYRNIMSQWPDKQKYDKSGKARKAAWTASVERGGPQIPFYGGKLCENLVQAVARDVMGAAVLRLEKAGCPVVMHIHDEAVCEVDNSVPAGEIERLMSVCPEWLDGCPIGAEATDAVRYKK